MVNPALVSSRRIDGVVIESLPGSGQLRGGERDSSCCDRFIACIAFSKW
jgi:hypothetical protein